GDRRRYRQFELSTRTRETHSGIQIVQGLNNKTTCDTCCIWINAIDEQLERYWSSLFSLTLSIRVESQTDIDFAIGDKMRKLRNVAGSLSHIENMAIHKRRHHFTAER